MSRPKKKKAPAAQAPDISVTEPDNALPPVLLDDLPVNLQEACARAGWAALMPVQELALPYLLGRRDLMVQSRTGSGKTGTYLLPLLKHLSADRPVPQALVLVPTRELAVQVEREAMTLFRGTGIKAVAVYGGVGYGKQMDALRAGAQLVVGTPGRVLDHLLRRTLVLDALRSLVFDEADRMLSVGFYQDMKEVQRYMPKKHCTTCLFSATFPPYVLKLANEFLHEPSMLSLSHTQVHVAEVQHLYCECKRMDKDRALVRLLETENPSSCIIFCNTKANVHYVTEVLRGFGYNADELSADLSQSRREEVLRRARDGHVRFLVATDVAARGIDIPELSHVILYEPPEDRESYIHRAGRTGRAGAAGTVISLVDFMQKSDLRRIASHYKINIESFETPTDEDVAKVVGDRLIAVLEARFRNLTGLEKERLLRFTALAKTIATHQGGEEDQSVLLAMLLDAAYQQTLHGLPKSAPRRAELPINPLQNERPRGGYKGRSDRGAPRGGDRFDRAPRNAAPDRPDRDRPDRNRPDRDRPDRDRADRPRADRAPRGDRDSTPRFPGADDKAPARESRDGGAPKPAARRPASPRARKTPKPITGGDL
ncbi:MAG: DEAD/DEAH box helicase [Desulfovibrionaceae bacterium]